MKIALKILFAGIFLIPFYLFAHNLDSLFASPQSTSNLEEWVSSAKKQGIDSPQIHHNLAALYAQQSDYPNTSRELLQATSLHSSPLARLKELGHLREVQRNLGIQHSTLEKSYFLGLLSVSKEALALLGFVALWSFFLFYYFQFTKRRVYVALPTLGVISMVTTAALWGMLKTFGSLAILNGPKETAVYASSEMKEKIISLPPGTVVRVRNTKLGNHQILEPIYGWVNSSECLMTDLPASSDLSS